MINNESVLVFGHMSENKSNANIENQGYTHLSHKINSHRQLMCNRKWVFFLYSILIFLMQLFQSGLKFF